MAQTTESILIKFTEKTMVIEHQDCIKTDKKNEKVEPLPLINRSETHAEEAKKIKSCNGDKLKEETASITQQPSKIKFWSGYTALLPAVVKTEGEALTGRLRAVANLGAEFQNGLTLSAQSNNYITSNSYFGRQVGRVGSTKFFSDWEALVEIFTTNKGAAAPSFGFRYKAIPKQIGVDYGFFDFVANGEQIGTVAFAGWDIKKLNGTRIEALVDFRKSLQKSVLDKHFGEVYVFIPSKTIGAFSLTPYFAIEASNLPSLHGATYAFGIEFKKK